MSGIVSDESKPVLNPRNGILWCPTCENHEEGSYDYSGGKPKWKPSTAKAGDLCTYCNFDLDEGVVNDRTAKLVLDKRTVLGPMKPVEVTGNPLLDAVNVLRVDGWVSGEFVCETGKKCLDGAVRAGAGMFADPEHEFTDWGMTYTKTREYDRARRRAERAEVTLAEEIVRLVDEGKLDATCVSSMFPTYVNTFRAYPTVSNATTIIYEYNDHTLADEGGRRGAVKLLRAAAERYNPRRRVKL